MSDEKRVLWVDEVSPIDRDRLVKHVLGERRDVLVIEPGPRGDPDLLVMEPPSAVTRTVTAFPNPKKTHKRNARRSKR